MSKPNSLTAQHTGAHCRLRMAINTLNEQRSHLEWQVLCVHKTVTESLVADVNKAADLIEDATKLFPKLKE